MTNAPRSAPPPCPLCQTALRRVTRSASDRLISLFRPVWRCRCPALDCGWEGRLRIGGPGGIERAWAESYRGRGPVLDAARAGWPSDDPRGSGG